MNANQILSADMLDLIFDDRNKAYGAYELRKSYDSRIKKALGITSLVLLLGIGGHLMAGTVKTKERVIVKTTPIELIEIPEDKPEPPPPTVIEPPPPVRTEHLAAPVITPDEEVVEPPPTQKDLQDARIDVIKTDGTDDVGIVAPTAIDDNKGVIEEHRPEPTEPYTVVQVEANFKGNWRKFLERNLNPNVPVDNGAPTGSYKVIVQFVVDIDGSVSNIRTLSNVGYGMEQEAIRVLKKADKWDPAIQNGHQVKAYRSQSIVFNVSDN
jgi:protein TonB